MNPTMITVESVVNVPRTSVWEYWTEPRHIVKWNSASEDWHTPIAENDLREGGRFRSRMEAKDGSFGFDFTGTYEDVRLHERIEYHIDDGRTVRIEFEESAGATRIVETFEAESENSVELQRGGWQSILDNFKRYAESQ